MAPCQVLLREVQTFEDRGNVRPDVARCGCGDDFRTWLGGMKVADQRKTSTVGRTNARYAEPIEIVMALAELETECLAEVLRLPAKHGNRVAGSAV